MIDKHPLSDLKDSKTDKTMLVRYLDKDERRSLRIALIERDKRIRQSRVTANLWRSHRRDKEIWELIPDSDYGDYMHPMILISINTGIRQGELFSLKWKDVNFGTKMLTIRGTNAKSHQTRFIPLNDEAIDVFFVWKRQNDGSNECLVFQSRVTGDQLDNVRKAWESIKRDAGIKNFRLHDMRHHFASMLVMEMVDLNAVRELLGHCDIKTTLRYAHLAPHHKARAVDSICRK